MNRSALPIVLLTATVLAACNTTPTPSVMTRDDAKNLKTSKPSCRWP